MREWRISLAGGRVLGGAEYGSPGGRPVVLFHGQPGNRLFHPDIHQTKKAGVCLIVPDRPGYGISTYQAGRKLIDWPGDVLAIADHFGFERFDVIGFSGGGPYALVCARGIPARLGRVVVVSGAPPMSEPALRRLMLPVTRVNYLLARYGGTAFEWFFRLYWRQARKNPAGFVKMIARQAPPPDRQVLDMPECREMLLAVWEENLRVDSRGYVQDACLLMSEWGFDLEETQIPVELWWGEADVNVPQDVMAYFSQKLPKVTSKTLPETAHFAILTSWAHILAGL